MSVFDCDWFQVRLVLKTTEHMCSVAFKDQHTQELKLPAGSSVMVPYTIVPLAVGKLPLEVMVLGRDMMVGDRVQKFLRVVVSHSSRQRCYGSTVRVVRYVSSVRLLEVS